MLNSSIAITPLSTIHYTKCCIQCHLLLGSTLSYPSMLKREPLCIKIEVTTGNGFNYHVVKQILTRAQGELSEPTHTLVPCWMPKPLPPRNQCTGCFAPAGSKVDPS